MTASPGLIAYLPAPGAAPAPPLRWQDKSAGDTIPCTLNVSAFLAALNNDTIAPASVSFASVPAGLVFGAPVITAAAITVPISGGAGTDPVTDYAVEVTFSTVGGTTLTISVSMNVQPISPEAAFGNNLVTATGVGVSEITLDSANDALVFNLTDGSSQKVSLGTFMQAVSTAAVAAAVAVTSVTSPNISAALAKAPIDVSAQLLKAAANAGLLPMPAIIGRVPHIDNYPLVTGVETTFDNAWQRLLADLSSLKRLGGKILIGPNAYPFANGPSLPSGMTVEGDAGHVGWSYASTSIAPLLTRPYSLLLTPGAAPATGNPNLRSGSLTLGDGCCVRHLNISSLPVALLAGTKITSVCTQQLIFNQMQSPAGGVGVASTGNDPRIENSTLNGFNIGYIHANAKNDALAAGVRPVVRDVRSHNWIGMILRNVDDAGNVENFHHFSNPFAPTTNSAADNAWTVTIASDGVSGSDLTITGGPAITGQVDGAVATIVLQAAGLNNPAPSSTNSNLNRFGDNPTNSPTTPATAPAVWRNRSGTFVLNLPSCAPASFAAAPATLAFEACQGTGIGVWLDSAGATQCLSSGVIRAQTHYYITDTLGATLRVCNADGNVACSDMTIVGRSVNGNSAGTNFEGGYSNGSFVAYYQNVAETGRGLNNSAACLVTSCTLSDVPNGGSLIVVAGGQLMVSGSNIQDGNIVVTGKENVYFAGNNFGTGTGAQGTTINGQFTSAAVPANLLLAPGNINAPAFIPRMTT